MTDSNRIKVAKKFIQHFANNEHEVLSTLLADDLLYTFLPSRAMDGPMKESLDKSGFIGFREAMGSVMTGYPVKAIRFIESESSNTVVVWATASPPFREELMVYELYTKEQWSGYIGEFVFIITANETGDKIARVEEFVDSKATALTLVPMVMRALENLGKLKQEQDRA